MFTNLEYVSGIIDGKKFFIFSIFFVFRYFDSCLPTPFKLFTSLKIISFFIFSTILETENYIYSVSLALALFYQGIIIAGFGFIGQTWLLKNYLPSKVTIISLSQPVFGVFLAWIILNETPGIELVFATILVVIGSYISVKK